MKLLLMFELSWRAVGRLIGVGILALTALGLVAVLASPGTAVACGIGLIVLVTAVLKAMKSDD
jgi:hypothetical protein